jgi:hypothetical protein
VVAAKSTTWQSPGGTGHLLPGITCQAARKAGQLLQARQGMPLGGAKERKQQQRLADGEEALLQLPSLQRKLVKSQELYEAAQVLIGTLRGKLGAASKHLKAARRAGVAQLQQLAVGIQAYIKKNYLTAHDRVWTAAGRNAVLQLVSATRLPISKLACVLKAVLRYFTGTEAEHRLLPSEKSIGTMVQEVAHAVRDRIQSSISGPFFICCDAATLHGMHLLAIAVSYFDARMGLPRTILLDCVPVPSSAAEAQLAALKRSVFTSDLRWVRLTTLMSDNTSSQDKLNRSMLKQQLLARIASAATAAADVTAAAGEPSHPSLEPSPAAPAGDNSAVAAAAAAAGQSSHAVPAGESSAAAADAAAPAAAGHSSHTALPSMLGDVLQHCSRLLQVLDSQSVGSSAAAEALQVAREALLAASAAVSAALSGFPSHAGLLPPPAAPAGRTSAAASATAATAAAGQSSHTGLASMPAVPTGDSTASAAAAAAAASQSPQTGLGPMLGVMVQHNGRLLAVRDSQGFGSSPAAEALHDALHVVLIASTGVSAAFLGHPSQTGSLPPPAVSAGRTNTAAAPTATAAAAGQSPHTGPASTPRVPAVAAPPSDTGLGPLPAKPVAAAEEDVEVFFDKMRAAEPLSDVREPCASHSLSTALNALSVALCGPAPSGNDAWRQQPDHLQELCFMAHRLLVGGGKCAVDGVLEDAIFSDLHKHDPSLKCARGRPSLKYLVLTRWNLIVEAVKLLLAAWVPLQARCQYQVDHCQRAGREVLEMWQKLQEGLNSTKARRQAMLVVATAEKIFGTAFDFVSGDDYIARLVVPETADSSAGSGEGGSEGASAKQSRPATVRLPAGHQAHNMYSHVRKWLAAAAELGDPVKAAELLSTTLDACCALGQASMPAAQQQQLQQHPQPHHHSQQAHDPAPAPPSTAAPAAVPASTATVAPAHSTIRQQLIQSVCDSALAAAESLEKWLLRWLLLPYLLCCLPTPDGPAVLRAVMLERDGVDLLQPCVMQALTAALSAEERPHASLCEIAADAAAAAAAESFAVRTPDVQQQQPTQLQQQSPQTQVGTKSDRLEYLELPTLVKQVVGSEPARGGLATCLAAAFTPAERKLRREEQQRRRAAGQPTSPTWGLLQVLRIKCSELTPAGLQLAADILSWAAMGTLCASLAPADVAAAATDDEGSEGLSGPGSLPLPSAADLAQLLPAICPMLYQWVCRFVYACQVHQQYVEGLFSKLKSMTSINACIDSKQAKLMLHAAFAAMMGTEGFTEEEFAAGRRRVKEAAQQRKESADRNGSMDWQRSQEDPVNALSKTAQAVDVPNMLAETGGCVPLMLLEELKAYCAREIGMRVADMAPEALAAAVEQHLHGSSISSSGGSDDTSAANSSDSNPQTGSGNSSSTSGRVHMPPSGQAGQDRLHKQTKPWLQQRCAMNKLSCAGTKAQMAARICQMPPENWQPRIADMPSATYMAQQHTLHANPQEQQQLRSYLQLLLGEDSEPADDAVQQQPAAAADPQQPVAAALPQPAAQATAAAAARAHPAAHERQQLPTMGAFLSDQQAQQQQQDPLQQQQLWQAEQPFTAMPAVTTQPAGVQYQTVTAPAATAAPLMPQLVHTQQQQQVPLLNMQQAQQQQQQWQAEVPLPTMHAYNMPLAAVHTAPQQTAAAAAPQALPLDAAQLQLQMLINQQAQQQGLGMWQAQLPVTTMPLINFQPPTTLFGPSLQQLQPNHQVLQAFPFSSMPVQQLPMGSQFPGTAMLTHAMAAAAAAAPAPYSSMQQSQPFGIGTVQPEPDPIQHAAALAQQQLPGQQFLLVQFRQGPERYQYFILYQPAKPLMSSGWNVSTAQLRRVSQEGLQAAESVKQFLSSQGLLKGNVLYDRWKYYFSVFAEGGSAVSEVRLEDWCKKRAKSWKE